MVLVVNIDDYVKKITGYHAQVLEDIIETLDDILVSQHIPENYVFDPKDPEWVHVQKIPISRQDMELLEQSEFLLTPSDSPCRDYM